MVRPPSHRRLSVWESIQLNQRLNHCVSTRPANKDDLSALSSFPLLSCFSQQHSQQFQIHSQRILCAALLYICISAIAWWREQGDTGIHLCPRCRQAPPTCTTPQLGTQDTRHIKAPAQHWVITTCRPSESGIYNSLRFNKDIKLVLTCQITNSKQSRLLISW